MRRRSVRKRERWAGKTSGNNHGVKGPSNTSTVCAQQPPQTTANKHKQSPNNLFSPCTNGLWCYLMMFLLAARLLYSVSDLRAFLATYLGPHLKKGCLSHTKTTQNCATAFLRAYAHLDISSHTWTASPYRAIRHALQARNGMLWTSSCTSKFRKPYLPGIATPFATHGGACPLPPLWQARHAWSHAWWL